MTNQTIVCVAAAFNGAVLCDHQLTKEDLPVYVLAQLTDFFNLGPESRQFNRETVLPELKAASYEELLNLLTEIGFRATPAPPEMEKMWEIESSVWQECFDRYTAAPVTTAAVQ